MLSLERLICNARPETDPLSVKQIQKMRTAVVKIWRGYLFLLIKTLSFSLSPFREEIKRVPITLVRTHRACYVYIRKRKRYSVCGECEIKCLLVFNLMVIEHDFDYTVRVCYAPRAWMISAL